MNEVLFREAATAAIDNAEDLLADTTLLAEHGRLPRVVSLAIIAQEELGKAIIYTLAALDVVDGLRDALALTGAKSPSGNHTVKQVATEFAGIIAWLTDEYESNSADDAPPGARFDKVHWYYHFLSECAKEMGEQLKDSQPARRYQQGVKSMLDGMPAFGKRLPPPRTPEEQKWAGLYVDLHSCGLSTPRHIMEMDAQSALVSVEVDFKTVSKLRSLLTDEELWAALKTWMRNEPE